MMNNLGLGMMEYQMKIREKKKIILKREQILDKISENIKVEK